MDLDQLSDLLVAMWVPAGKVGRMAPNSTSARANWQIKRPQLRRCPAALARTHAPGLGGKGKGIVIKPGKSSALTQSEIFASYYSI